MLTALAVVALVLALIPALVFSVNLRLYRPPPRGAGWQPAVSVLIPARNEERSIGAAVEAALASRGVELEVVVLDDHSQDRTAAVVEEIARGDSRVRLEKAPELPPGWCGKQHACWVLSRLARHDQFVFVDADVRLTPDGLAGAVAFLEKSKADLVSGFPRQETGTPTEQLVIPLIHFLLLGYLPMWWMRKSRHPAYGVGCGQLFLTRRSAYEAVGGHAVIRTSLHDGVTLPRAFRQAGLMTDLFDATDVATCRMYRGGVELWHGLAKNATEGMASPAALGPWTVLLFGGHILPVLVLAPAVAWGSAWALGLAAAATALSYYPRLAVLARFRQPWLGAVLHPLGVLLLLLIQWYALGRFLLGRPAGWRGRAYPT